jgi:uncharacterized protein YqgC (DUF456 family)
MLVGLVGLIIPVFPGLLVIWLAALAYGLATGFETLGIVFFILITILMLVGAVIDNILMAALARQGGASWGSIILGVVAGLVGTFLFPPIGGLIAAPAVILLLEFWRRRDWGKSWQATRSLVLGWGLSFLVRFGIGLLMIALWLVWAFSSIQA